MIWFIEAPGPKHESAALLRRDIPGLRCFGSTAEAIQWARGRRPPDLILIPCLPGEANAAEIDKLAQAMPRVCVMTLTPWLGTPTRTADALSQTMLAEALASGTKPFSGNDPYRLSEREREVLTCMVRGLINKEIAERLAISYHTVDNHQRRLYHKLGVHTRAAAVAKAILEHLT